MVLWCALWLLTMGLSPERAFSAEKGKRLSENDVLELLSGGVPSSRVAAIIAERGIDFASTPERERKFREAGATQELISALREASKRATKEEQPRRGILNVQSKSGEAQVYLNDELKGITSPEGKLRLPDLPPGTYKLRISLPGYQSWENQVDITTGENLTISATLPEKPSVPPAESATPTGDSRQQAAEVDLLPVPNAKVRAVRFFESGNQAPAKNQRQYQDRFDIRTSRYIYWELNLVFPKIQSRIDFDIDAVWYAPNGNVIWRQTHNASVQPGWTNSWHVSGWGCNAPPCRNFEGGSYKLELLSGSRRVATGSFEIY
jgi:hypothetical protein